MRYLTIAYDPDCGLCTRIGSWLSMQPAWIPLRIVSASELAKIYPALASDRRRQELTVVSSEGGVYFGDHAWLMCLYALKRYRSLACRLSRPALLPFARQAFKVVSANRHRVSVWLESLPDAQLIAELRPIHAPSCHGANR